MAHARFPLLTRIPGGLVPALAVLTALVALPTQYLIWIYAPVELTMGPVQKIFYTHMPLAAWSMVAFFATFVASILHLVRQGETSDALAGAAAEVGTVFAGLALVTGSIWGRAAWNVWWTWDPRLTTTLIMWFVYAAYLVVRNLDMAPAKRSRIAAVLGVVAFLDVPLVFVSARMFRSIHPAVLLSKGGGLEPEMLTALFASIAATGLLCLTLVLFRARQIALSRALARRSTLDALL